MSLLYSLLFSTPPSATSKSIYCVSPLVRHYNIRTVTAHVHETNEGGLKWYSARGFDIQDGIVEGYYRRLKPGGARIVRWDLQWGDGEKGNAIDLPMPMTAHETGKRLKVEEEDDDDEWEKIEAEDGE
jgi:N-alpha-acetyltransferase 50